MCNICNDFYLHDLRGTKYEKKYIPYYLVFDLLTLSNICRLLEIDRVNAANDSKKKKINK